MKNILVAAMAISSLAACNKNKGDKHVVAQAVAFAVQKNLSTATLWYIETSGNSFFEVVPENIGIADNNPAWSPDGRRIFFIKTSDNKGENGIYAVKANGSEFSKVFTDSSHQLRHFYQLCADSRYQQMFFSLEVPRADRRIVELYSMTPSGGRIFRRTQFETTEDTLSDTESYAGSFSPGDSLVVFTQANPSKTGLKDIRIYTLNVHTNELKLLKTIKGLSAKESVPSFSPDSRRFLLSISGLIYSMNRDGSDLKPLGSLKGYHPCWDKNGVDFYFSSFGIPGMEQGIYKADINLTSVTRITRSPGIGIHGGFRVNL